MGNYVLKKFPIKTCGVSDDLSGDMLAPSWPNLVSVMRQILISFATIHESPEEKKNEKNSRKQKVLLRRLSLARALTQRIWCVEKEAMTNNDLAHWLLVVAWLVFRKNRLISFTGPCQIIVKTELPSVFPQ